MNLREEKGIKRSVGGFSLDMLRKDDGWCHQSMTGIKAAKKKGDQQKSGDKDILRPPIPGLGEVVQTLTSRSESREESRIAAGVRRG